MRWRRCATWATASGAKVTLRLRLTLFYTLLVALVLTASGAGLYLLLARNLTANLDSSLLEASRLLSAFIENEDGKLSLQQEGEGVPQLRADLAAAVLDARGKLTSSLGRVPAELPAPPAGFSTWQGWRVYAEPVSGNTLLTLRELEAVNAPLEGFVASFALLAPLAVLTAFALGYLLAGRALAPVDRLTRAAYDLARRRAWRERLPEPERRDELWRLAAASNALLGSLEEVIEGERRFTADASHELRTPLTVLRGRLESALEIAAGPKIRSALRKALSAADDLLTLIEKLLLLARTEVGQAAPAERVALDELAFEVAEALRPHFDEKGLALGLELPEAPAEVLGDSTALGLLVSNLLENAGKFTTQGQVTLRIERGQRVRLTVEDSGPGIPEAALPHLFERFYQADVRHRRGGSGLGLAIVASIARWHGGRVSASNRPGGGARFLLELPAAPGLEAGPDT